MQTLKRTLLTCATLLTGVAVYGQEVAVPQAPPAAGVTRLKRSDHVELVNGMATGIIRGLDTSGYVRGLPDLTVSFYKNGALVAQVLPGTDGVFNARLAPGFYTLVAYGPSGYCVYAFEAVESRAGAASDDMQIETLAVPPSDFGLTYELARRYAGGAYAGPLPAYPTPADVPAVMEAPPGAPQQTTLSGQTVYRDASGGVPGRLNLTHQNSSEPMNAFLIRGGRVVHETQVAADGSFRFPSVSPGGYSFIAAGPGGFMAFSVLVDSGSGTGNMARVPTE